MKKAEISKVNFEKTLVSMLFGMDKVKDTSQCGFLCCLLRYSPSGEYFVQKEYKNAVMVELKITESYYKHLLRSLEESGDLRRGNNGVVYFHPKYKVLKNNDGQVLFVIKE